MTAQLTHCYHCQELTVTKTLACGHIAPDWDGEGNCITCARDKILDHNDLCAKCGRGKRDKGLLDILASGTTGYEYDVLIQRAEDPPSIYHVEKLHDEIMAYFNKGVKTPPTETYLCKSYYDDDRVLRDCRCGRCA